MIERAAVAAHEDEVVLVDLATAALPARLDHAFGHRRHAPHVVRGQLTAAGVRGQRASATERARRRERAAFTLRAEAVVLERDDHGEREAVVDLGDVDVVGTDPRHRERSLARLHRAGGQTPLAPTLHHVPGMALAPAPDVRRRLLEVAGALAGRDHHRDTAVRHEATVEEPERLGDPARVVMILDGDRVAHLARARCRPPSRAASPRPRRSGPRSCRTCPCDAAPPARRCWARRRDRRPRRAPGCP